MLVPHATRSSSLTSSQIFTASVFGALERAGIACCHWKSNVNLSDALDGTDDVDLLIDAAEMARAQEILLSMGCRPTSPAPGRADPGLEDFLALDPHSGRLLHFHVHYRLASGEQHMKRVRLPWERDVLDARVRTHFGMCIPEPTMEATMLLVRAALKLRRRDRLDRSDTAWFADEFAEVRSHTTDERIVDRSVAWLGEAAADPVRQLLADPHDGQALRRLRSVTLDALDLQTRTAGVPAAAERLRREHAWFRRGINRKVYPDGRFWGRGGRTGGLLVAVIGSDGSGKSTVSTEICDALDAKIDCFHLYFGSGDGRASALRTPLVMARRATRLIPKPLRTRLRGSTSGSSSSLSAARQQPPSAPTGIKGAAKAVWALTLAREKRQKLAKAHHARSKGVLVVCDRYPQNVVPGMMDGPLLTGWADSSSSLRRRLAAYEAEIYDSARRNPPDLVLELRVDPEVAAHRRPDHDPDDLKLRIASLASLDFAGSLHGRSVIDANQPLNVVIDTATAEVFRHL